MARDADELAAALGAMNEPDEPAPAPPRVPAATRSPVPVADVRRVRPAAPTPTPEPPELPKPGTPAAPPHRPAAEPRQERRLERSRTLIPPLLVGGALMLLYGGVWFLLPAEHPLRVRGTPGVALAAALLGMGLLGLGLYHMATARSLMRPRRRAGSFIDG